jgi:hypothetical protein
MLAATAAFGAVHCATSGNVGELRARAAFDLACPADSLQVQSLAERTYGVDGCGKRATYVWAYQNQSWLLDNRSGASAEPSAVSSSTATPAASPVAAANVAPASAPQAPRAPAAASEPKPAADAKAAEPAKSAADTKAACDAAQEYRRRAAGTSGVAQAQLLRIAERKEAECRGQGQDR